MFSHALILNGIVGVFVLMCDGASLHLKKSPLGTASDRRVIVTVIHIKTWTVSMLSTRIKLVRTRFGVPFLGNEWAECIHTYVSEVLCCLYSLRYGGVSLFLYACSSLFLCLFTYLFICLIKNLSLYLSTNLCICISIYQSISVRLSVYLLYLSM